MNTAIEHRQCCDISEQLQNVAHYCGIILAQLQYRAVLWHTSTAVA